MYDVVRVAVISTARFLTGSLELPGGRLLFIGPANNAVSAYFEGFELPSMQFPRPPPPPEPSAERVDPADRRWRPSEQIPPPAEGRKKTTGGVMSPMYVSNNGFLSSSRRSHPLTAARHGAHTEARTIPPKNEGGIATAFKIFCEKEQSKVGNEARRLILLFVWFFCFALSTISWRFLFSASVCLSPKSNTTNKL